MRIQFLGTGGYHPNERRHTACILLPELGVVLDAGTSAFRIAPRLETQDVQIFLTHAHLDHIVGLTYLLVPLIQGRIRRAELSATAPVLEAVREHLFAELIFPVMPEFEFCELKEGQEVLLAQGARLKHFPLASHPGASRAYRIDVPARSGPATSLAYVTDTTVDGTYTEFIRGVDLLIHECYFRDKDADWAVKTGHSHTTQVAELAREAGVGRLMLMHLNPLEEGIDAGELARASRIFPEVSVAEDLWEIHIGSTQRDFERLD